MKVKWEGHLEYIIQKTKKNIQIRFRLDLDLDC